MFNNFFATYNIVDPPQSAKTLEYATEEPMNFNDYYKLFIPQIILQLLELPPDIVPPDLSLEVELPDHEEFSLEIPEEPEINTDSTLALNIIGTARLFLGWNYISGGNTPKSGGFDCSGLLHYVFSLNNVNLPRSTTDIFKAGQEVSLSEVQPGDIICTPGTGYTRKHVKMVSRVDSDTGQIYVIEAKGKKYGVIESPLTNTRNITTIRRVLGNNDLITQVPSNGKFSNHRDFVLTLNQEYLRTLRDKGLDPRYSYILVAQDANESRWGTHLAGNFNYGGIKSKTGRKKKTFEYINGVKTQVYDSFRDFASLQDYCNYKINLLLGNTYNAFLFADATDPSKFIRHVNDSGYSTTPSSTYVPYIMGIYRTVTRLA